MYVCFIQIAKIDIPAALGKLSSCHATGSVSKTKHQKTAHSDFSCLLIMFEKWDHLSVHYVCYFLQAYFKICYDEYSRMSHNRNFIFKQAYIRSTFSETSKTRRANTFDTVVIANKVKVRFEPVLLVRTVS